MIAQIHWIPVSEKLPDDDITVLIADVEGDVTLGFLDGDDGWRYCSGERAGDPVTHWAHVPAAPNANCDATRSVEHP